MEKGNLLIALIELVVLLIPIGGLVWKAAIQSQVIKELKSDMESTNKRVDKLEEKNQKDIEEIKSVLNNLNVSFAEIKTALSYISENLKKEGKING